MDDFEPFEADFAAPLFEIGSRIIESVNEVWFIRLYKAVLTAIALRLVVWEGLAWIGVR